MTTADVTSLSKVEGCLVGVAIGDALGMPVETWSHEKIMSLSDGKGVLGFMDPLLTRVRDTANLKAGDTTDDWQLTKAVARSIIRTHGQFNLLDCADEHVRELKANTFGWGKTTQIAIEDISSGRRIVGLDKLAPAKPGTGCGNGVIMKVTPIAINEFARSKFRSIKMSPDLWNTVSLLGDLTHPDKRASIAAYAVARFVHTLLEQSISTQEEGLEILRFLIDHIKYIEKSYEHVGHNSVSGRLERIEGSLCNAEELSFVVGCGFHALETAAFSIGTFLRHPTDFKAGLLEAVNAGGDTDTNASVVGALIGANCGLESIPKEWVSFNPNFQEAIELARQLYL